MKRIAFIWGIDKDTYNYTIVGELLEDGSIVMY